MLERTLLSVLEGAARAALRLYPRTFRNTHGEDLVEVFLDDCRARARRDPARLAAGAPRRLLAIAIAGLGERSNRPSLPAYRIPPRGRQRAPRGARFMTGLVTDVRSAVRALRKQPAFTAMVIGMLALGVAANAAIFSAFNAVLLRPLPFAEPERLIDLDETAPAWNLESVGISYPDFHAWHEQNRTFESMAVYTDAAFNLAREGEADRVGGARVSWQLLGVFGLRPLLGRDFTAADDSEGAEPVVMVSEAFWRERLGGDPAALGTLLRLNGVPHALIGVLPPQAVLPEDAEVWAPLSGLEFCCDPATGAGSYWLEGVGRMAAGVTLAQALEDVGAVHAGLVERLGDTRTVATPRMTPLHESQAGRQRPMLTVMLGAVALLLLIACGNVAGLMLVAGGRAGA